MVASVSTMITSTPISTVLRALRTLLVAAGLTALMASAARPVAAIGPLPECRLADISTVPNDYDSWSTTLVDWLLTVGEDYVPPDLVPVGGAGIAGGGYVRGVAIDDLRDMTTAAAAAGNPIGVLSPYRGYAQQVELFNGYASADGYDDAITYSARPGHSEHQLGLGVDFMTAGGGSPMQGDWATTPAGAWMYANAWTYGWVLSYPKGTDGALFSDVTCFHYEPWHYRYLGREMAALVHDSGLTIREYLWYHFTMVDPLTGQPIVTASPTPSPSPTPEPTATPAPTQPPTATPLPTPTASPTPEDSLLGLDGGPVLWVVGLAAIALIGLGAWQALARQRRPRA